MHFFLVVFLSSLLGYSISITYYPARGGFAYRPKITQKSGTNKVVFSWQGLRTHLTHLVCLRHWGVPP